MKALDLLRKRPTGGRPFAPRLTLSPRFIRAVADSPLSSRRIAAFADASLPIRLLVTDTVPDTLKRRAVLGRIAAVLGYDGPLFVEKSASGRSK